VIGIIPGVENMPLQIRRGTEAERTAMTQPLAQGELLYVTNDQRLYIGNGSTLGGVQITGYTNEDAQDAAAQIFSNGTHTGITFTYNDTSASLSAALDLSNFSGTIRADAFKGSVFADDGSTIGGTLLVDAVDGVLRGTHIGTLTGNVTGNVTGTLTGSVVGNVTGTLTGSVVGDVKGSVFADDSVTMVDSVNSTLSNGTIKLESNRINVTGGSSPFGFGIDSLLIGSEADPAIIVSYGTGVLASFVGTTAGSFNSSSIQIRNARGTLTAPTASVAGDLISPIQGYAYDGVGWNLTGSFGMATDPDVAIGVGAIAGTFFVSAFNETGGDKRLVFNSKGALIVPIVQTGSYTTINRNLLTAAVGMIIYNTTDNKFQGYQNTGGTTPQWVDLS
jgi:hypothetical protein